MSVPTAILQPGRYAASAPVETTTRDHRAHIRIASRPSAYSRRDSRHTRHIDRPWPALADGIVTGSGTSVRREVPDQAAGLMKRIVAGTAAMSLGAYGDLLARAVAGLPEALPAHGQQVPYSILLFLLIELD